MKNKYKVVTYHGMGDNPDTALTKLINIESIQGWEVVSMSSDATRVTVVYFNMNHAK